jgi:hypothetical protein
VIERLTGFPDTVLAFVSRGRVTNADYEAVVIPAVVDALKKPGKIRLYYETGADFAGIDPGAAWQDFKVGIEHVTRWERVAVVTDVEWMQQAMRLFSFLLPRAMKAFPVADSQAARSWIVAER